MERWVALVVQGRGVDAARVREALERRGEGWSVVHVPDVDAAIDRLNEGGVVLIFLDLPDPSVCGLEPLLRLRSCAPAVPVIVQSVEDSALAAEAVHAGAQDWLVKQHINEGVLVRVARYAVERSRVLARLLELDQLKSKFISTVSHEMRTPLAIVREFVSLVHDGVTGEINEQQHECLESALRNCDRLTGLIEDLLDMSQIESGKIRLLRVEASIAHVLEQCRDDFAERARAKGQRIVLEVEAGIPSYLGDADKILQVVVNLVGNAHKFNGEGVTITLRASVEDGALAVDVIDDGIGIAPEDRERIFEAFTQIDRQHGPGAKGTGLGLTISRTIVQLHHGTLALDTDPESGCRFRFTLPLYCDGSELAAFVEDRRRTYQARNKAASLAILRTDDGDTLDALDRIRHCAEQTLRRRRDEILLVRSHGLVACVLESAADGGRVALDRLGAALGREAIAKDSVTVSLTDLAELRTESDLHTAITHGFMPLSSIAGEPEPCLQARS